MGHFSSVVVMMMMVRAALVVLGNAARGQLCREREREREREMLNHGVKYLQVNISVSIWTEMAAVLV